MLFLELSSAAQRALTTALGCAVPSITFTPPRDARFGDATTTIALELGKRTGNAPMNIATIIERALEEHDSVERVEIIAPGYVNAWLKPSALFKELNRSREASIARVTRRKERPIIVEGADPNIAKPLGVHHIMSTVIGQSIANVYRHFGYNVIHWNYIGDWGTQFGHLAVAVRKWGTKEKATEYTLDELLALYVRFHEEAESDAALFEEGRQAFHKLEEGNAELIAFWSAVVAITKSALVSLFERLHVSFDLELGESFYNGKMQPIIDEGVRKKVFTEGEEGALIVRFPKESGMPVSMVRRSDGATLYSTRDLAQMRYRIDTYNPQAIFIPTDVAQSLYFQQLIATCRLLGWEVPEFEHVVFGRMRFRDASMSTRKGNILKLEEVLDEAVRRADRVIAEHGDTIQTDDRSALAEMMGTGAVAYSILSQNRKQDIVFDWDKMLAFDGNSAPYLQYTYARARSLLRKAPEGEITSPRDLATLAIGAFTQHERVLLRVLLLFSSVLEDSLESRMPHKIANHLYELAQAFNAFYNTEPILRAESPLREFRVALTDCTASFLKTGAEILTIRLPERM